MSRARKRTRSQVVTLDAVLLNWLVVVEVEVGQVTVQDLFRPLN